MSLLALVAVFDVVFTTMGLLGQQNILPKLWRLVGRTFVLQLLFAVVLAVWIAFRWQKAEKHGHVDSLKWYARGQGILRYWLAFGISLYGFAKILKLQFAHGQMWNDIPVGRLPGLQLTWNYFGHSYAFAVIIALCQIGGCILLLFRRTTLLGRSC
ncbi:MAG TPA: hypothetical protein VGQ51_05095 [Puia sp.]|nr:hypothetical protein [Puia sp.]